MRCVECGNSVPHVLVFYDKQTNDGNNNNVGLSKCVPCRKFADVFVEYELSLVVLHLLLLSPRVWRHVLFNKPNACLQLGWARTGALWMAASVAYAGAFPSYHPALVIGSAVYCGAFAGGMGVLWHVAAAKSPGRMMSQFLMYAVGLSRSFAWVRLVWWQQIDFAMFAVFCDGFLVACAAVAAYVSCFTASRAGIRAMLCVAVAVAIHVVASFLSTHAIIYSKRWIF